jgi:predicted DNA-binding ribbon-helix-helix protein
MKSAIVKRSVVLAGHKTSVSLEEAFWRGLKDIASSRRSTLSNLIGSINTDREQGNLSSAIRLFVLSHYQARPGYEGQTRAAPAREMMMTPPQPVSVLRAE